jgi:hypothetical protein
MSFQRWCVPLRLLVVEGLALWPRRIRCGMQGGVIGVLMFASPLKAVLRARREKCLGVSLAFNSPSKAITGRTTAP